MSLTANMDEQAFAPATAKNMPALLMSLAQETVAPLMICVQPIKRNCLAVGNLDSRHEFHKHPICILNAVQQ